jgi:hypothetical protein
MSSLRKQASLRVPRLEDVLITNELRLRPSRPPQQNREIEALHDLAAALPSEEPLAILNRLLVHALGLCRAGSAGVSLLEENPNGEVVFRWVALAGVLKDHTGGCTPRSFSPCGTCLDRGSPQLYSNPARYFTYLNEVTPPIVEGLVIPFYALREPIGTIWIVSHGTYRRFDREDARIMTSLANFTGAVFRALQPVPMGLAAKVGQDSR